MNDFDGLVQLVPGAIGIAGATARLVHQRDARMAVLTGARKARPRKPCADSSYYTTLSPARLYRGV